MSPDCQKTRVCLLTSSHPVSYSRFLDRQAGTLAAAGFAVTLIGLDSPDPVRRVTGVKTLPVAGRGTRGKLRLLATIARLAAAERSDIYECLDPWTLAIGLAIKRARPGVRIVYDSSEWFPRMYLDRTDLPAPVRWLAWLVVTYLEHAATRRADSVLETNLTRARRFSRRGCTPVLVPNFPPAALLPERTPVPALNIAYTGLVSRPRGFDRLLQAMAKVRQRFPDARLHVVGRFDPRSDLESWSRNFTAGSGLDANVVFHGTLPYDAMFRLLGECLVGVILLQPRRGNDFTGLPNKLFEFMGSGLAVIASDFPEMARVVLDSGAGWLVDPSNPDAIAAALVDALSLPAACRDRGEAGRRAVLEKYRWETAARNLLAEYRRITVATSRP